MIRALRAAGRAALVLVDAAPLMLLPTAFVALVAVSDDVWLSRVVYGYGIW